MPDPFDAIVIGSGIGGLTAARLLSWFGGMRVLVLEQHTTLGGLTHTFTRPNGEGGAPYEFATGVHYLGRNSEGASLPAVFAQLSEHRLQWQKLTDPFDIIFFPKRSFAIPDDEVTLKSALATRFPAAKVAIDRYFRDLRRAAKGVIAAGLVNGLPRVVQPAARILVRRLFPLAFTRTEEYLTRVIAEPALRSLLTAQWGNYGVPPSNSAFGIHAIVTLHYLGGAIYPIGGPAAIAGALIDLLRRDGSEARMGARACEILVEHGRAVGVLVEDRRRGGRYEVRAPIVISDAGLRNTLSALLPQAARARFAPGLAALANNSSGLVLFIGLKASPRSLGVTGANHWLLPGDDHEVALAAPPGEGVIFLSFPSLKNAAAANHAVEVVCPISADAFRAWAGETWPRRAPDYLALKERLVARLLERIDLHLPGFRHLVAFAELATPLTFTTFQQSPAGAFYGLACTPERLASSLTSVTTPIPGLFLSGQDTVTPGIMGAAIGGILAASSALPLRKRARLWRTLSLTRMPHRPVPAPGTTWKGYLKVIAITRETPSVKSFRLEDPDSGALPFSFAAGQFITLTLPGPSGAVRRSYSLTSAPGETRFCTIAVKRENYGAGSRYLHDHVVPGRCLKVEGPSGHFTLPDGVREPLPEALVLIGGGIGVTPLIAVLRDLAARNAALPVTFIGCFRTSDEIIFRDELASLAAHLPHLRVVIVVEAAEAEWPGARGRLTPALITDSAGEMLAKARVHLCGPKAMMTAVVSMLTSLGVGRARIRTEDFAPSGNAARERAIVTLAGGAAVRRYDADFGALGRVKGVAVGQSLLDAALAHGVALRHTCGGAGACGDCRLHLTQGVAETEDPNGLLSEAERRAGWVLACQTYPTGNIVAVHSHA